MDYRLIRVSVLAFVTALALIIIAVVASNSDLFRRDTSSSQEGRSAEMTDTDDTGNGERIGDDLKAFLKDPDFFDSDEMTEEEVVFEQDVTSVTLLAEAFDNAIETRILNNMTGDLEMGVLFQIRVTPTSQARGQGEEKVFTDENEDGRIEATDLPGGIYRVELLPMDGYHVPAEGLEVTVSGATVPEPVEEPAENDERGGSTDSPTTDDASDEET